jgi:hypothetical protein
VSDDSRGPGGPPPRLPRPRQIEELTPDQTVAALLRLAMEVSVLRDRLRTHEALLEKAGVLSRAEVEAFQPDPEESAERMQAGMRLVEKLLGDLE